MLKTCLLNGYDTASVQSWDVRAFYDNTQTRVNFTIARLNRLKTEQNRHKIRVQRIPIELCGGKGTQRGERSGRIRQGQRH